MVDILKVDADALRELGKTLTGQADAITGIKIDVAVTMPGSPVHEVSAAIDENAEAAFHALGDRVRNMARVAGSGAKTYEEVDTAFGEQFGQLMGEAGRLPSGKKIPD
ncbi:hypothetical protein ACFVUS_37205 [Nocardia sp. NPDC058058]|uniref:hypothetical protein n=1 Tax=Nocardia sp. NPDC058058 TaxID=3346317 RepID=UPI0036DF601D